MRAGAGVHTPSSLSLIHISSIALFIFEFPANKSSSIWRSSCGDTPLRDAVSTACLLYTSVAQGQVLDVDCESFGSIGAFAIPEMDRFYRHVPVSYTHLDVYKRQG